MSEEPNDKQTEAPEAPTDPQPAQPELSLEDWQKEAKKAREEAAKYRTRLREREEAEQKAAEEKRQAELSAEERAKEAERKAQEALAAAEARVQAAERKAALAGHVTHPDRVMRLMDDPDEYFDGAEPNVEAILEAFPEYKPAPSGPTPTKGAGGNAPPVTKNPWKPDSRNLTEQARILKENPPLAQQLKRDAGL